MRRALAVILSTLTGAAVPGESWTVRVDGIGPVRVGMTAMELASVLGQPVTTPDEDDEAECFYVEDRRHDGVGYMITSGRVARVDVRRRGTATLRGAMVGDSIARLEDLYGESLERRPHFYRGLPDLYLTYRTSDKKGGVRFETSGGLVARFYAGKVPELEYVEGCS